MKQKRKKSKIPFFSSVHFKLPLVFILLLLLSLQLVGAYFIRQLEQQMLHSFDDQMSVQIGFLQDSIRSVLQEESDKTNYAQQKTQLSSTLRRFNVSNLIEAQVVDESGIILATSDPTTQGIVGQHTTDNDIYKTIYSGATYNHEYFDSQKNIRIKKYVLPIISDDGSGGLSAVLSIEVNIESIYTQVQNIVIIFLSSSFIAIIVTVILTFLISRGVTRPLQELSDQIERIAEGNYSGQVKVYGNDEIGQLARSVNYLSIRVKEAQDSTESERQRLDSVLRHMTDGVIATNRRNRVILTNERTLTLIGKTEEEVMGHPIMEVLNLRDKYTMRELMYLDKEIIMSFDTDNHQRTVVKGEFSVIQKESGFISGLVWVLTDVTEHEKIEEERRQFVSNVSHELRTPLTSVRSYSEALYDGAIKNEAKAKEFLNVIQRETDRMIRMISDLLKLSRMDSDKEVLDLELVDFNRLVQHVLDRFDMMLKAEEYNQKKYELDRELGNEPYWVEIDQDRMIQVIDNILNNAIKYSPDGGKITVRLISTHNEIVLSVQDEGLGMPQGAIPHVFDRFYRIDKARSREQGGTGLGLAIAKEVIELHRGRIWVNSIENKGSTFFIALPFDPIMEEEEW